MSYIFMDQSGDLGFDFSKDGTSDYFVIAFLFVKEKKPIEKIIRKAFTALSRKNIKHHSGVLHCYKEHPRTRQRVLSLLAEKDISIISIYLNKHKVYTRLHDEKTILYNYVTNILLDRVYSRKLLQDPVAFIASKRETNRFLNENFKEYLEKQVMANHRQQIGIEIKTPAQEKCLQLVDFVCWAMYRKRQWGDNSYYDLIKKKIVEENPLFP